MQAGKQRCRHMGWAQGIRHILLDEDLLQNEGKLGEKGFLKGSVCTESTRIACLQPQPAASLHAAMPVVQHHLEHGRKVEPGRAGQISRPVDQTHLAVPGAAVVTRLLKPAPFLTSRSMISTSFMNFGPRPSRMAAQAACSRSSGVFSWIRRLSSG